MDNKNVIHIHSAIKKNEILNFSGKWMELEKNILNGGGNTGTEIQMTHVLSTWREREMEEMNNTKMLKKAIRNIPLNFYVKIHIIYL